MLNNYKNVALVSDFDGTITKKDFFYYAIDNVLKKDDIKPWNSYLSGEITHVEALDRIFSKIRLETQEFHRFILNLSLESCFLETVYHCKENKIDLYIVSAGADYYINYILKHLNIENLVTVVCNKSKYSPDDGLRIIKSTKNDPFYSYNYGISKKQVMQSIRDRYDHIVFAGDGNPDFEAAKLADQVFARGVLLDLCRKNNVKAKEFRSYCEILEYLQ